MRPLTKKYIFECKLKGEPIDLSHYAGKKKAWASAVRKLIEFEILTEDHTPPRPYELEFLDNPQTDMYILHYPIIIQFDKDGELFPNITRPQRVFIKYERS